MTLEQPKKREPLATTFQPDEVRAVVSLMRKLHAGEDPSGILRSKATATLYAKFVRMHEKAERVA